MQEFRMGQAKNDVEMTVIDKDVEYLNSINQDLLNHLCDLRPQV